MHYVHSFFRDYPRIRLERGCPQRLGHTARRLRARGGLSDRGPGPESSLEARIVAAKACSFVLNLLALPALYVFARRRYGCRVAHLGDGRARRSSGPRDLRRVHPAGEPGGALVDPGGLDADGGLARRIGWARQRGPGPSPRACAADWPCSSRMTALALLGGRRALRPVGAQPQAARAPPALGRHHRRRVPAVGVGDLQEYRNSFLFDDQLF